MTSAEASSQCTAPMTEYTPDPPASRRRMLIGTFEEADRLFQDPPRNPMDYAQNKTGGTIRVHPGGPRFPRVTIFEPEQLPYISSLNLLLSEKFAGSFSDQIIAAYREDLVDDTSRFDRAFLNGIKGCLAEFAEEFPELLPVLKGELSDVSLGVEGIFQAQAITRFYVDAKNRGENPSSHIFQVTERGYHPNRNAFIAPHIKYRDTYPPAYTDSATLCPGKGIAVELVTQALHAHDILSQEADSSIFMEPFEAIEVPKELRKFVHTLYENQKEKEMTK